MLRITLFSISGLLLSSCATMPGQYTVRNSAELPSSQEAAWAKAIQYFAAKNIPLTNLDKSSGFILAEWTKPHYVCSGAIIAGCDQVPDINSDCGRELFLVPQQYQTRVNVLIQPSLNGKASAQVTTAFSVVSRVSDTARTVTSQCVSTGRLEGDILRALGGAGPDVLPQPMQPVS